MGFERTERDIEQNFHFKDDLAYTEDEVLVFNIFVYKIPKKVTQEETLLYFSQFGEVNKVRLVTDKRKTRKTAPKVGFIHYDHAADAAKVLRHATPHVLKFKRICVRACDSWHQPSMASTDDTEMQTDDDMSTDNKTMKLTMLNDDCLEHIVKKLGLKDQVRFSLTCQRFRNIFEMVCKTEHKNHKVEDLEALTLWEIREFFLIAGPNIEALLGAVPFKERDRIIEFISRYCPNIKSINFDCIKLKSSVLNKLFDKLKKCSVLELRDCSLNDHAIVALRKMPNLEYLSVADNFELTGKHMERLTTIKTLILYGCGNIQSSHFIEVCKALKDLQTLDIQRCERLTTLALAAMVENCHKLEALKISCPVMPYECVARLPCLKKLELLSTPMNVPLRQHLFEELAEHKSNQLETLKIVAKNSINIERARQIARLTNLKHLICANNENLTDDCLHKFAELKNLEEIVLTNCRAITNEGLLYLVRRCTKLKKVNIQLCLRITDQFIFKVIEVLKKTQNQRGKDPCVFHVARSGISTFMINHADYVAATSLMKLSFYVPAMLGFDGDEPFGNSDYSDNDEDDFDGYYLSDELDDDDYDPYDMFDAFSDADDVDDDIMHNAYNVFGRYVNYGDVFSDINDFMW